MSKEGQLQADAAAENNAGATDSQQQSSSDSTQTSTNMMDEVISIQDGLARFGPSQGVKPKYQELDVIPPRQHPGVVDDWAEDLVFHFDSYDSNKDGYISRQELLDLMSKRRSYAIARGVMENFSGLVEISKDEPGSDFRGLSKSDVTAMLEAKERFDFLLRLDLKKGIKAFDKNGNKFATSEEVNTAYQTPGISYDEKNFLKILKNNYRTVITASNDERGLELTGITDKDIEAYQEQMNKRSDVESCRRATMSILQLKQLNVTQPQKSAAEVFLDLVNGPIFKKLNTDSSPEFLSYSEVTKMTPVQAFPNDPKAQEALGLLQSDYHALAELEASTDNLNHDDIKAMVRMYENGDEHWTSSLPAIYKRVYAQQGKAAGSCAGGYLGGLAGELSGGAKGYYDGRKEYVAARGRFAEFMHDLEDSNLGKAKMSPKSH